MIEAYVFVVGYKGKSYYFKAKSYEDVEKQCIKFFNIVPDCAEMPYSISRLGILHEIKYD